jgi:hypothetical protein
MTAHSRVIGLALYGREHEAMDALAAVRWTDRAPLVQAMGVCAEGIVELLCRRAPARALELTRKARALASVAGGVPGAAQSARFYGSCVAAAAAVAGEASASDLALLGESRALAQLPILQLLATFGLAVAAERVGDLGRSAELRRFLERMAPHCRALALGLQDFAVAAATGADEQQPGAASAALASGGQDFRRTAVRSANKLVTRLVGTWALLIAAFVAVWFLLNRR